MCYVGQPSSSIPFFSGPVGLEGFSLEGGGSLGGGGVGGLGGWGGGGAGRSGLRELIRADLVVNTTPSLELLVSRKE